MTAAPARRFEPRDLRKQAMIQGVALSPDGQSVVYARRVIQGNEYRTHLWRVPYRGGRATRLTAAAANDVRPRFSPDGRSIMFSSDRGGAGGIWVMPVDGGEPRKVRGLPDGASAAEWSPDGTRIAALAPSGLERFAVGNPRDPVARHITDYQWRLDSVGIRDQLTSAWVVPARGGKGIRVTRPELDVMQVFWSPDGDRLGLVGDAETDSPHDPTPSAWSVPAGGGKERLLGSSPGGVFGCTWTSAGLVGGVMVEQQRMGWERMRLARIKRHGPDLLGPDSEINWTMTHYGDLIDDSTQFVPDVAWLDARTIVARGEHRGRSHAYAISLEGDVARMHDGDVVTSTLATGGGRVVVVANVDASPGEVFAVEDGGLRQLTTNGGSWFATYRRQPERIPVRHREGHRIEGWLLPARGKKKAPLVVDIHGGPHCVHSPMPWMEMLAMADAGIHVVWCNPRGSSGYGDAFASAITGAWGEKDTSDLLAVIDHLIRAGRAERSRVGVVGLSYGGFMVHWLLGHAPGRFAAGVSENPVTDLAAEFGAADFGVDIGASGAGTAAPFDEPERWHRRSPASQIHRNEVPLLLLQCESDMRCPAVNSEIPFAILKSLGRPVEMVRYPDEFHSLLNSGRPDRRVDRLERIVGWFKTHL